MSYRIGIDARFFRAATGGIGRYTRELLVRLAATDTENTYRVFLTPEDLPEWHIDQPNFQPVVVDAPYYTLQEQTKFLAVLQKEKLDLVHFLNFNLPILYSRPFITTLHDLTVYHFPVGRSQKSKLRRMAFIAAFRRSLTGAKRIIAISEHSAHDAAETLGVSQAKMEVIYEGAPAPIGEVPFGTKALVQDFLETREPYFLFVSQWRPHKGLITLVEAFEQFKQSGNFPHKLVLAGSQKACPPEMRERIALSSCAKDIIAPGFVPDDLLQSLYHYAVAAVTPSEYEGFGLPILEGFAAGTPVIAANNSSLPELVGSAGILFPTGDVAALTQALGSVATDEAGRAALVVRGYEQLKRFSWDAMAAHTHQLYLRVLEKRR
jgi:glycosyltransferase involved in cell wall biosynthesis